MASTTFKNFTAGLSAAVLLLATGCATSEAGKTQPSTKPAPSAEVAPAADSTSPTPTPAATPTTPATPEPLPSVPKVSGMSQAEAEQALVAAGFVVGEITEVPSARPAGTVLRQGIGVGTALAAGTPVALELAVPYPQVPSVIGRMQRVATGLLRDAGFTVKVQARAQSSGRDGVVLEQTPAGSQFAKPGAPITIVVSRVVRAVAPTAPDNCASGYDPCLPPASDYDCAGGSGDGPAYANGPIYVTGSDPYDLDSEGDGVACE